LEKQSVRNKPLHKQAWPAVEPPELKGTYVGFWARLWASYLDTMLIIAVAYPLLLAVRAWDTFVVIDGQAGLFLFWVCPAVAIVGFWITCAATPGKMAIGAKIVDAVSGGHPTSWQFIKRYIGYVLSGLLLCGGFIRAGFDPKKQGWHDQFAGTVVIYPKRIRPSEARQEPNHATNSESFQMFQSYCAGEEDHKKSVVNETLR
jgi:uncharacterized RDD family membrane protein YckC